MEYRKGDRDMDEEMETWQKGGGVEKTMYAL